MTFKEWLDLEINGEHMIDYQSSRWLDTPEPRVTFVNFCMKAFKEWQHEQ